jgi:cyclase
MLKKRIIFTLLYDNGQFILSRNFRLQKVGSLEWLKTNYNFSKVSYAIDELMVLDVTRGEKSPDKFCETLKKLTEGCFVPISAGGGVRTIEAANMLLRSGADKIVINSPLFEAGGFVKLLAREFGRQCVVASMDIKTNLTGDYQVWKGCGSTCIEGSAASWVERVVQDDIGELYLNSMNRDGTGQGFDMGLLDLLPPSISKPVILAGGVGNSLHLVEGLSDQRVDAVATAHLFNFIGDGLRQARGSILSAGINLPIWDGQLG